MSEQVEPILNERQSSQGSFALCGEDYPLVEPGLYDLAFVEHRTVTLFGKQPKLRMDFRIVSMGKANGLIVCRWYNIKRIKGKPGRHGEFDCGRRSDFILDAARLIGPIKRTDRVPMSRWRGEIFEGRVDTVSKNYRQVEYPAEIQYSVVRELIRVKQR